MTNGQMNKTDYFSPTSELSLFYDEYAKELRMEVDGQVKVATFPLTPSEWQTLKMILENIGVVIGEHLTRNRRV